MQATQNNGRGTYLALGIALVLTFWALKHVDHALNNGSLGGYVYQNWVFIGSFIMLCVSLALAHYERPRGKTPDNDTEHVVVMVPAYNEDPIVFQERIESIIDQSRPVQAVYIVDDGSTEVGYRHIRKWFFEYALDHGVIPYWTKQTNAGKRHAQASAFIRDQKATVYVTVDSDSVLDHHAIEELLKPFSDPQIQSVAGVVLARNNTTNLLARVTDLLFVTGQLVDRSMMSTLGSVLVNSGGLAAYRAAIVRDNLDAYLSEQFFGRNIEFSDDSMLTLYALSKGKTVQQPSAYVFTMMPDKMSHHLRQQLRWMKGSFIRSWWRIRYLPILSFGFARQVMGWSQFVMTTIFLWLLIVIRPDVGKRLLPFLLIAPLLLGYVQALRYLSVKRSDESFRSQLFTYALAPVAVMWSYFVLRPVRVYAMITCLKPGWGTRQKIEVSLAQ